jgi:hypothetical protein
MIVLQSLAIALAESEVGVQASACLARPNANRGCQSTICPVCHIPPIRNLSRRLGSPKSDEGGSCAKRMSHSICFIRANRISSIVNSPHQCRLVSLSVGQCRPVSAPPPLPYLSGKRGRSYLCPTQSRPVQPNPTTFEKKLPRPSHFIALALSQSFGVFVYGTRPFRGLITPNVHFLEQMFTRFHSYGD